jgi:hypothetical protein
MLNSVKGYSLFFALSNNSAYSARVTFGNDDTLSYGLAIVTISGNVTGDFFVNVKDDRCRALTGKLVPPAPANVDFNGDDIINIKDATLVRKNWQKDPLALFAFLVKLSLCACALYVGIGIGSEGRD